MKSSFPRVLERTVTAKTKWLQLLKLTYEDAAGRTRQWDAVHRSTTAMPPVRSKGQDPAPRTPDAVAIFALLRSRSQGQLSIVLVRQFRPPLDTHTIELPAGLVDKGETVAEAALRELKEETGYKGSVLSATAGMGLSPGLASETASFVKVEVDLDLPANAKPIAEPDEGEYVERIVVPITELTSELDRREQAGDIIFPAVRAFASGWDLRSAL